VSGVLRIRAPMSMSAVGQGGDVFVPTQSKHLVGDTVRGPAESGHSVTSGPLAMARFAILLPYDMNMLSGNCCNTGLLSAYLCSLELILPLHRARRYCMTGVVYVQVVTPSRWFNWSRTCSVG